MIHGCTFRGKNLRFHDSDISEADNVFTILVGKNGIGKSHLLKQIVCTFVPLEDRVRDRSFHSIEDDFISFSNSLENSKISKIIASSTSPFDKFPLDRKKEHESIYAYLGLKGLYSSNLSLSFISRTIGSLIDAVNASHEHLNAALRVFDYLGYVPYLKARTVLDIQPHKIQEILNSENCLSALSEHMARKGNPFFVKGGEAISKLTNYDLSKILYALSAFVSFKEKPRLDIILDERGIFDKDTLEPISDAFSILFRTGILRTRDISLRKRGVDGEFQIGDASSGEQCVLMSFLGIASQIEDKAIICIDEPEICLHPAWQEKYIELLIESFSYFKGCHFIVATHSPQIVANLANRNCFVLDVQKGETVRASEVNKKSADFQLANVFGAPGFKNEYLSREIISALGILGTGGALSAGRLHVLREIIQLKPLIDLDDPVHRLIGLLSEALEG